ncbi:CLUMA_CG007278, isoform A [Clunio marinus]|uniref:CLUMA_CG007278, isoform A n=1 Tax=Clunio marinus TaxID=568069 RepID=A0A1J1I4F0_9DIPT|nr:CLUMA_CG007278, isoform A [Clunio marinus]
MLKRDSMRVKWSFVCTAVKIGEKIPKIQLSSHELGNGSREERELKMFGKESERCFQKRMSCEGEIRKHIACISIEKTLRNVPRARQKIRKQVTEAANLSTKKCVLNILAFIVL